MSLLLVVALVLFLAIFAIKLSNNTGVPVLLLFIALGIGFSMLGYSMDNFVFADKFATIALMVIMFQGGFSTNWRMAKPVAVPAIIFSSLGVVGTALLTGLFCHWVLDWDLYAGMLIGSIVGSTDYSSVSNILRSQKLNLKYNTASLLELESGSNDPFAYTMTMIFLSMLLGKSTNIPLMILMQVGLGCLLGFALAKIFCLMIDKLDFAGDGLLVIFTVATAILVYALTVQLGGNGYLAVYIYGIYLGNKSFRGKRDAVFFFDGLGDLMQIALFFMLGLLSNWDAFLEYLPLASVIMLFMFFIARPLSVYLLSLPFKLKSRQKLIISVAGLRGAAAIAFAVMATNSGVEIGGDIYNIIFGICVTSLILQGSLMAPAAKKLDMLDPNDTVLRTFNDYQDKSDLGFIETYVDAESQWAGVAVKDLNLAFDFIVAKIVRDGQTIVPKGDTIVRGGDLIVLGGESHFDPSGQNLVEVTLNHEHPYVGQAIRDLDLSDDNLIIMIQRDNGEIIVPQGSTIIAGGDTLVSLRIKETKSKRA